MPKQKENVFVNKRELFSSPETIEDIHWSSSESEELSLQHHAHRLKIPTCRKTTRKRKRKNKSSNNLSNLDVTIIDASDNRKTKKSPVLSSKHDEEKIFKTSPILKLSPQYFPPYKCSRTSSSPVLLKTSPILSQRLQTPRSSQKIRKQLFSHTNSVNDYAPSERCKSPVLIPRKLKKDKVYTVSVHDIKIEESQLSSDNTKTIKDELLSQNPDQQDLDTSFTMLKTSNSCNIAQKVKAYFDSHFSSQSISQHSIVEIQSTPTTSEKKSSDEVDISNSLTQQTDSKNSNIIKSSSDNRSKESIPVYEKTKKVKYKKDGLAYRLDAVLKKRNTQITLWQHEQFLAANSHFVIPKLSHLIFQVHNFHVTFGSFILNVKDSNDKSYIVVISNNLVNNFNVSESDILKIYEPYSIIDYNFDRKLILNVCKFEFVKPVL